MEPSTKRRAAQRRPVCARAGGQNGGLCDQDAGAAAAGPAGSCPHLQSPSVPHSTCCLAALPQCSTFAGPLAAGGVLTGWDASARHTCGVRRSSSHEQAAWHVQHSASCCLPEALSDAHRVQCLLQQVHAARPAPSKAAASSVPETIHVQLLIGLGHRLWQLSSS